MRTTDSVKPCLLFFSVPAASPARKGLCDIFSTSIIFPCGNIFFDKLKVEISKGNLLAEDHYYPHGLPIKALSSALTGMEGFRENRRKYQSNEYIKDLDLNWMSFGARQYDPQIGRFLSIDPLADGEGQQVFSPYAAMGNAPESMVDPDGTDFFMDPQTTSRADGVKFLTMLSTLTGLAYDWNSVTGQVKIVDPLAKGAIVGTINNMQSGSGGGSGAAANSYAAILAVTVDRLINDHNVQVTAQIIFNDQDVFFDSYATGEIDQSDFDAVSNYPEFQAGQLAHLFEERMATQGPGGYANQQNRLSAYRDANGNLTTLAFDKSPEHTKGLAEESKVMGSKSSRKVEGNDANNIVQSSQGQFQIEITYKYSKNKYKITTTYPSWGGGAIFDPNALTTFQGRGTILSIKKK